MAALAGELNRQIKGHSEGEKGFRPWWDTVEDNLMYAFVLLGKVTTNSFLVTKLGKNIVCRARRAQKTLEVYGFHDMSLIHKLSFLSFSRSRA